MFKKIILPLIIIVFAITAFKLMTSDNKIPRKPVATQSPPKANIKTPDSDTEPPTGSSETKDSPETKDSAENKKNEQAKPNRGMRSGVLAKQGATSVEAMTANAKVHNGEIKLFGTLSANEYTTLTATSTATVTALNMLEGDSVQAGQSLATLVGESAEEALQQKKLALDELDARIRNEKLTYEHNLAALEINTELLRIAKNSVDRFSSLNSQQLTSGSDYEASLRTYQSELQTIQTRQLSIAQYEGLNKQLIAQRESLKSEIRQAQKLVNELEVKATFDGLVARLSVTIGQELRAGDTIAELYNPDSLMLYARVPMRYRLDQMTLSDITATDDQGQRWHAVSIRPLNESGAQRIRLHSANQNTQLPGTHLPITLQYPINQPTILIPETALYDQQRIYTVAKGIISAKPVAIVGRTSQGYLIDATDFDANTRIVTTRIKNPVSGMAVSVVRPNKGA